jgi:hypothetical protein
VLRLIELGTDAVVSVMPSAQISLVTRRKLSLRRCDCHFRNINEAWAPYGLYRTPVCPKYLGRLIAGISVLVREFGTDVGRPVVPFLTRRPVAKC